MGQAAVDLPDPSELPAAPVTSADDLLSQMAGDEIDRLLAEAEVEKGPPLPEPEQASAAGEIHPDDAVTAAQMDELFKDMSGEDAGAVEATPPTAVAEAPAPVEPTAPGLEIPTPDAAADAAMEAGPSEDTAIASPEQIARELDEALSKGIPKAPPEAKAPEVAEPAPAPPAETETTTVEKNALTDAIESIDASNEEPGPEAAEVPIYLKPLVWLNAPMNALPTEVRDALGKIALLTLANAVAVLAYVMIFRRHHH